MIGIARPTVHRDLKTINSFDFSVNNFVQFSNL